MPALRAKVRHVRRLDVDGYVRWCVELLLHSRGDCAGNIMGTVDPQLRIDLDVEIYPDYSFTIPCADVVHTLDARD